MKSNSSVLPSHTALQFKVKPFTLSGGTSPVNLMGRITLRRVVLFFGGLLFAYIIATTVFMPMIIQNQHSAVKHKESDPYEDSSSPPPNGQHPGWRSSQRQQQQQGQQEQQEHLSGSGGGIEHHPPKQVPLIQLDPIGEKNRPWQADQDNSGSGLESGPISDTGYHSTDKEEVIVDDEANVPGSEISEVKESAVAIATQERKASPVSYAHFLSAIRRERNYAIALMVREADLAVQSTEVYSVTNKNQTAPSNDVHDYLSLSKYYWPNKNKLSGLPYKRIDGHVNPEIETVRDYRLLRTMIREVHIMGMAYHFTGRKEYADKCAMRLSEWFLDEATYMNPNINYGSLRKGEKLGARTGILDMFTIFRVFDALHYLKQEPTWPQDLIPRLQKWFSRYVQWLETASLARLERDGDNNHGTYFDVQIIGIYLFLGRVDDAREIARKALHKRIDPQINAQGMQPEELARKTSWYYSVFNLQALMTLARWGDDLGVDMWSYEGPEGQSIKKAVDFLLPFSLSGGEGWPVENLRGFDMTDYLKCLQIAWHIYGDEMYIEAIEVLEPRVQKDMDEGRIKSVSTFMCDISTLLEATVRGGQGFIWHWCLT